MRKEIFILGLALVGLLIYAMSFREPTQRCEVTRIVDLKNQTENLQIEFIHEDEIDSVAIIEFSYVTDCVAGTLEHNASYKKDLESYSQEYEVYKDVEKDLFRIKVTVSDFIATFPYECEWPSHVDIVARVYTKQWITKTNLRISTNDFKKIIN